jgi:hypothetical protein
MARRAPASLIAVLAAAMIGCAPVATPSPSQLPSPPAASPLAFPATTGAVLAPGRYASSPPFDIPFTFEVPAGGWESMHLHGEFFDIGRFATEERQTAPARWIAFGHPEHVRSDEDVPVAGLTPEEAATLLTARDDLSASETVPWTLAGLDGVRLDLHAPEPDTPIFGGPEGDFGLEPSTDIRIGFVPFDGGLLVAFVGAPADELDAAWEEAQPILDSVDL